MSATTATTADPIADALADYWGYTGLRPQQREAIEAGLQGCDSLVVLPTGGGKSLCYQIPALVDGRTDVVVSPLISLMKDQVDALRACGYQAAALHSGLTEQERSDIARAMLAGKLRLVFVAPERLLTPWFISLAKRSNVRAFAIDEAHCISQWGHDFRPEYRRLSELRTHFPEASIHAYTATATERVRRDIIEQLGLRQPQVLVGRFDRPNLTYRVLRRNNLDKQLTEILNTHRGEAAIVYCLSRADTERVAEMLKAAGFRAEAYHAGMDARTRSRTQDAFAAERLDVVVATVAFGMGIDRSNVRCVVHATMPKSVEHYQQESGRAGRDGLEAECVLLHGQADARRWQSLLSRGADGNEGAKEVTSAQLALLDEMEGFCTSSICRHKALSEYFGQPYDATSCGACDICLHGHGNQEDVTGVARRVIECVQALKAPFGVRYVADVLRGASSERITSRRHDRLSVYGNLSSEPAERLQSIILQLVATGLLHRTADERPVLSVTAEGKRIVKEGTTVTLTLPQEAPKAERRPEQDWTDVDRTLFENLRGLRRSIAEERGVAPFVIFSDAVLRDMARYRPTSLSRLAAIRGVGDRKLADLGARFVEAVASHVRESGAAADIAAPEPDASPQSGAKALAYSLFASGTSLDDVAARVGRSCGTVSSYLEDYVAERRPESIGAWVTTDVYERITEAASRNPGTLLKPVYEALGGTVSYDEIRVAMKHAGIR